MADKNNPQVNLRSNEEYQQNYMPEELQKEFLNMDSFERRFRAEEGGTDDSYDVKLPPQQFQTPTSNESGVYRPSVTDSSKPKFSNSGYSGQHRNPPPEKSPSYTPIHDDELDVTQPDWEHDSVSEIYYNFDPPHQRSHQMERVTTQPALEEDQQPSPTSPNRHEHHMKEGNRRPSPGLPPKPSKFGKSKKTKGLTSPSVFAQQPPPTRETPQFSQDRSTVWDEEEEQQHTRRSARRAPPPHPPPYRSERMSSTQAPPSHPPPYRSEHMHSTHTTPTAPPPYGTEHMFSTRPPPPLPPRYHPTPLIPQPTPHWPQQQRETGNPTPSYVIMTDEWGNQSCIPFSELMTSPPLSLDREVEKSQLLRLGILTPIAEERGKEGNSSLSPVEWILEVKYLLQRNPSWRNQTKLILSKLHRRIIEELQRYHRGEDLTTLHWDQLATEILTFLVPQKTRDNLVASYVTAKQTANQTPAEFFEFLTKAYEKARFFSPFDLQRPEETFYFRIHQSIRSDPQMGRTGSMLEMVTQAQQISESLRKNKTKQNSYDGNGLTVNKVHLEDREIKRGNKRESKGKREEKVRSDEGGRQKEEEGKDVEGERKMEKKVRSDEGERQKEEEGKDVEEESKREEKGEVGEDIKEEEVEDEWEEEKENLPTSGEGNLSMWARVHGLEELVLIDTGASTSFISKDEIDRRALRTKKRKRRMVTLPDGFQIREEGVMKTTVQLQGIEKPLSVLFHVVNMTIPPIIGYDVLRENSISINCGEGTISHQPPISIPTKIRLQDWMEVDTKEEELKNIWDLDQYGPSREEVEGFLHNLTPEMKEAVLETGIIPEENSLPPPSRLPKISLNTGNAPPKRSHQRPMNATKFQELKKQTKMMLEGGIIEEVKDPKGRKWQSNILMVSQPPRNPRFCMDPSYINKNLVVEEFNLPLVRDVVAAVARGKYYSSLDLSKAYWQVGVQEEDQCKLVFKVGDKYYKFKRLPFGLKSASFHIQSHLSDLVEEEGVFLYIDDIVISAETQEEHDQKLLRVLGKLKEMHLMINVKKSKLNKKEIEVLGHKVVDGKILALDSRIQSVANWPTPKTKEQLVTFVSLLNYHSNLIPNLARRSEPLQRLRRKGVHFKMTKETNDAFYDLRTTLSDPNAMLQSPLEGVPFHIEADASTQGTGAVLFQMEGDNKRIIAYTSSALSSHEQHIHASELETLAAVRALEAFRDITYGQRINLYTDNEALSWMLEQKQPTPKQTRWLLRMLEFNVVFHHIEGDNNEAADALSRRPMTLHTLTITHKPLQDLLDQNKDDEGWLALKTKLEEGGRVHPKQRRYVSENEEGCMVVDGDIYKKVTGEEEEKLVLLVSPEVGRRLIAYYHDHPFFGGHLGIVKTQQKIQQQVFWEGMDQDVYNHVTTCQTCQQAKPDNTPGLNHHFTPPSDFNIMISIDVMKVARSDAGPQYFLIIVDHFTKFAIAVPMLNQSAEAVTAALLHSWVQHFGAPQQLLSDQAAVFEGDLFKSTLENLGVEKLSTEGYSSQSNGLCERVGGIVQQILRTLVPQNDVWDLFLPFATHCYNTSLNQDLGMTPHEALFGREPKLLPIDLPMNTKLGRSIKWRVKQIRKKVTKKLREKTAKKEAVFQQKKERRGKDRKIKVGGKAWVKRRTNISAGEKTQAIYEGPYNVLRKIRESHWELEIPANKMRGISSNIFHRRHLKAHRSSEGRGEYVGRFIWKRKDEIDEEERQQSQKEEEHKQN